MAEIVLAIGTSHGPMLSTPPEFWGERVVADRAQRALWFRGAEYGFEALAEVRQKECEQFGLGLDAWRKQNRKCQDALAQLADVYRAVSPDVAIIVGNDQREIFGFGNMPAICVYRGESVENIPSSDQQKALMPPGIAVAEPGHRRTIRTNNPCHPELAWQLLESLTECGFDPAQSDSLPDEGSGFSSGIPHAFGFIYRQIMLDEVTPHVPVILNTQYAPNRPTALRCWRLGNALGEAVAAWNVEARVAIIASGGLSHFVVDEEFDRSALSAMATANEHAVGALPEAQFQSGTAEIKNWLPVAAAAAGAGLSMHVVDYVPCYRSEAGTGNAMGFAYWNRTKRRY